MDDHDALFTALCAAQKSLDAERDRFADDYFASPPRRVGRLLGQLGADSRRWCEVFLKVYVLGQVDLATAQSEALHIS